MSTSKHIDILNLLNLSKQLELVLENFYRACAQCVSSSEGFWLDIAEQEHQHAAYIDQIEHCVKAAPDEYRLKTTVFPELIRSTLNDVNSATQEALSGTSTIIALSSTAEQFESLMVEYSFYDLLDTENDAYQELVNTIKRETAEHRVRIRKHDWTDDL